MGEFVTLVREPTNAYDANAIRVLNQAGTQVCLSRLCGVCMYVCVCFLAHENLSMTALPCC
jgi:hypothetical protein